MRDLFLRARWRAYLLNGIRAHSQPFPPDQLRQSALIVSPHFDDETLGCGGLIIKKKRAGADVAVMFMTDGSRSHPHLMPPNQLADIRAHEGVAAACALGLRETDVIGLGFEESHLVDHIDAACAKVARIIYEFAPEQVYIPYSAEPFLWSADHRATTQIVYRALSTSLRPVSVYEYPIWSWYSLPWINPTEDGWRNRAIIARNSMQAWLGLRFLRDFHLSLDIRDILVQKWGALEKYGSQMTPLIPDVGWATLSDVSNGQFLACFFQEQEFFRAVSRHA